MSTENQFDNFKYSRPVAQNIAGSLVMGFGAGVMAFDSPRANKTVATAMLLGSTLYGASKGLAYFLMLPFALVADSGRNLYYIYNNINANDLDAIGADIDSHNSPGGEGEEGGEEVENYLTSVILDNATLQINAIKPASPQTTSMNSDTDGRIQSRDFLSSPSSNDNIDAKTEQSSLSKSTRP